MNKGIGEMHKIIKCTVLYLLLMGLINGQAIICKELNGAKVDPLINLFCSQVEKGELLKNNALSSEYENTLFNIQSLSSLISHDIIDGEVKIDVWIKTNGDYSEFIRDNIYIGSTSGDYCTSLLSYDEVKIVSQYSNVNYISRASLQHPFSTSDIMSPNLDISIHEIEADKARDSFNVTGEGVILGFIDDGFDIDNNMFNGSSSNPKVLSYWNQGDTLDGYDHPIFPYGCVFDSVAIYTCSNCRAKMKDYKGHGTAVSGCALSTSYYSGVSPGADVVLVKLPNTGYTEIKFINACQHIANVATELDRPFVITYARGNHIGPHNGTSELEMYIDNFIFENDRLIKGFVVSAGNSCFDRTINPLHTSPDDRIHARDTGNGMIGIEVDDSVLVNNSAISLQIWYPYDWLDSVDNDYYVTLIGPSGTKYGPVGFGDTVFYDFLGPDTIDGAVNINHREHTPTLEGNINIDIFEYVIGGKNVFINNGTWWVRMIDSSGSNDEWDLYVAQTNNVSASVSILDYDSSRSITNGGNVDDVITVGAFNTTRDSWMNVLGQNYSYYAGSYPHRDRSHFSSLGPTRDGGSFAGEIDKPNIYAPGAWIVYPRPLYLYANYSDSLLMIDSAHSVGSGTSVAAPMVAGAIALIVEADLKDGKMDLSHRDIKSLIESSGDYNFGNYYLNVYNAIMFMGTPNGESLPEEFVLHQNSPNPFNPNTHISFSLPVNGRSIHHVIVRVFNLLGQEVKLLYNGDLPPGPHEVEWDGTNQTGDRVAAGVYFYKLDIENESQCKKMVLLK